MGNSFSSRRYKQALSDEFLREYIDIDNADDVLDDVVTRFERSYAGVASYRREPTSFGGKNYVIDIVRTRDADPREIESGVQAILHWITEYDE